MTNPPPGPNSYGAQDECASCAHPRHRHRADIVAPERVCGPALGCGCDGDFVELPQATRMARFVEAAQGVAHSVSVLRDALQEAMRSTQNLHGAMLLAGLLPDEPALCDGCDTIQVVTATDDGQAQLCSTCQAVAQGAEAREAQQKSAGDDHQTIPYAPGRGPIRYPALQQLDPAWHHVDCDKTCGGTCTQGRNAAEIVETITPLTDIYCPDCRHPWEYGHAQQHATGACTMPVVPGTHTPIASGQTGVNCGCTTQQPSEGPGIA